MSSAKNLQILIVDDQQSMRELTKHCLNQIGISQVTAAKSGEEALDKLGKAKFDLIISDWNMDGISGLELLTTIRSNPSDQKTAFHHGDRPEGQGSGDGCKGGWSEQLYRQTIQRRRSEKARRGRAWRPQLASGAIRLSLLVIFSSQGYPNGNVANCARCATLQASHWRPPVHRRSRFRHRSRGGDDGCEEV